MVWAFFRSFFERLMRDLARLDEQESLRPDVVVLSGDLAEWGRPKEFDDVLAFSAGLLERLKLQRERVVLVPGNHDISRALCEAYFLQCKDKEELPKEPFVPKWENFSRLFAETTFLTYFRNSVTVSLATVLLTLAHTPGALGQVLVRFGERGVNLSRIESRPVPGAAFRYRFYLDLDAHAASAAVTGALGDIAPFVQEQTLLGTYPAAEAEGG